MLRPHSHQNSFFGGGDPLVVQWPPAQLANQVYTVDISRLARPKLQCFNRQSATRTLSPGIDKDQLNADLIIDKGRQAIGPFVRLGDARFASGRLRGILRTVIFTCSGALTDILSTC